MENPMSDLVYVGLMCGFFAATWGFVRLVERL
jgi:hypothetical protein